MFRIYLLMIDVLMVMFFVTKWLVGGVLGIGMVLMVESDEFVCKLMVRLLNLYGFKMLEVIMGVVAVDIIRRCDILINLLVTNITMSDMSGK